MVQMDGYVWRGYNRSYIHRNAPKASGGVGLLIKQWIFEEFDYETLDMSFEGILCSKFTSKHSDYNFLVFSCYLPPEISVWGRDSESFFAHILGDIYSNSDCDAIYLCGDLNARIGSLEDISEFDIVPKRSVLDNSVNQHGHSFIEFLNEAKFCTLNGRFNSSDDNYTSVSSKGSAVVDYICVPHDTFEQCLYFKVIRSLIEDANLYGLLSERSKIPDHSILLTEFRIHSNISQTHPSSDTCNTYRILTEFKVFMYWKDPPRANRGAEPRSGEALRFVRAGLSST